MTVDKSLWGVQPSGFYAPTIEDILADETADLLAVVDPGLDLDADAPEGQTAGIRARQYALAWEALQVVHDANNPDNAEADLLDDICKLDGTVRPGAAPTVVVAQCTLTSGTVLAAGTALANVAGFPDVQLTPAADFTAPSDGTFDVTFACVDSSPISVPVGSLQISAPISGWTSIGNTAPGVLGHLVFDDTQTRLLRESELARTGSTTTLALQADIDALPEVVSSYVLENTGATTDANGLPPHTIAPVVYASALVSIPALAQTIWEGKPAGVGTYGTTAISYTDTTGVLRTVSYTPVEQVPIYLSYSLITTTGYVGSTAVAEAVATALTQLAAPGTPVRALKAEASALALGGVVDVNSFALDVGSPPTGTTNIALGAFQIATFAAANITVTP
jgi:hypothetical protein